MRKRKAVASPRKKGAGEPETPAAAKAAKKHAKEREQKKVMLKRAMVALVCVGPFLVGGLVAMGKEAPKESGKAKIAKQKAAVQVPVGYQFSTVNVL